MTAAALAGELRVPLFTVVFDTLISKFMGETASKLRVVFEAMNGTRASTSSMSLTPSAAAAASATMSARFAAC